MLTLSHITRGFTAFDSIVTLLPIINYGMRKTDIGGLSLVDMMDFPRNKVLEYIKNEVFADLYAAVRIRDQYNLTDLVHLKDTDILSEISKITSDFEELLKSFDIKY